MKNIIHKMKYIAVAVIALSLGSCDAILDDEITDFGTGPNLVGFEEAVTNINVGEGVEDVMVDVPVMVIGPTYETMTEDVVVTWAVDPSSTAEEGVHYRLPSSTGTVELNPENEYTSEIPLAVITEGLTPPNSETLILNVTEYTTDDTNVLVNEKTEQIILNLNVLCHADLAGEYLHEDSGLTVNIEELGIAEFVADNLAPFTAAGYPQARFVFTMDCEGNLTITDFPDFTNTMEGVGTINEDGSITFTDMSISGVGSVAAFTIIPQGGSPDTGEEGDETDEGDDTGDE